VCLLSHPKWQILPNNSPEKRTVNFLKEAYLAISNDKDNRLKAGDKKVVLYAIRYTSLTHPSGLCSTSFAYGKPAW
jgi:hypothetical protein